MTNFIKINLALKVLFYSKDCSFLSFAVAIIKLSLISVQYGQKLFWQQGYFSGHWTTMKITDYG